MGSACSIGLSKANHLNLSFPFYHFLSQKGYPMKRDIVKDIIFLQQKAAPAAREDKAIGEDLKDTLSAHSDTCAGLAANMIGFAKAIIAFRQGKDIVVMYNPELLSARRPYEAEEGCLSLSGTRKTTRYEEIEVKYRDSLFRVKKKKFKGFVAEVIQHEMDHLEGKLI